MRIREDEDSQVEQLCLKEVPDWVTRAPANRCEKKWICHYFTGRRVFTHEYPGGYGANDGCPAFFEP